MAEESNSLPLVEETPAAETPETTPESPKTAEEPAPKTVDETPDPASLQAEIERLRKVREKAEEDAAYWRAEKQRQRSLYYAERERGPSPPPAQPSPAQPMVGPQPKASDFDDYDKFVEATVAYNVKAQRAQWDMEQERKEQEKTVQRRQEELRTKLQEGYQLYPDFEDVAFDRSASHITPAIVDILADCDHPADLAYYLAKNRVEGMELARIARESPVRAARMMAKLEDKIVSGRASNPNPSPKPTTKAPPPIKPVGSRGELSKDPDKMTMKEFEEWRLKQGAKRF